jgi:hypothetical protein
MPQPSDNLATLLMVESMPTALCNIFGLRWRRRFPFNHFGHSRAARPVYPPLQSMTSLFITRGPYSWLPLPFFQNILVRRNPTKKTILDN